MIQNTDPAAPRREDAAGEREGEDGAIDWLRTVVSFGEKRGDLTLTLGTHLLRNALAAHDAALSTAERERDELQAVRRVCDECEWTNTGLLNVGDPGKPRWLCHGCIKRLLDGPPAEMLAAKFHETYELLAPKWGYKTREASAKPWGDVPEPNKSLMVAVAHEVLVWLSLRVPSGGEEGR